MSETGSLKKMRRVASASNGARSTTVSLVGITGLMCTFASTMKKGRKRKGKKKRKRKGKRKKKRKKKKKEGEEREN